MYAALQYLLYLWDLEEQRGRGFKLIVWREAKGGSHKVKGRGALFIGELTPFRYSIRITHLFQPILI